MSLTDHSPYFPSRGELSRNFPRESCGNPRFSCPILQGKYGKPASFPRENAGKRRNHAGSSFPQASREFPAYFPQDLAGRMRDTRCSRGKATLCGKFAGNLREGLFLREKCRELAGKHGKARPGIFKIYEFMIVTL